jgi:hypothetical protein
MIEFPENLSEVADEALAEIETALTTEFDAQFDGGKDVAVLSDLADKIEAVRNEAAARFDAAEQIAALAERVRVAEVATDEPEVEAVEVEQIEAAEVAVEAEAVIEQAEEIIQEATEVVEAEVQTEQERELVTASADNTPKAPSASAVRAASPAVEAPAPTGPSIVITAAADIPGYNAGGELDRLALAKAMHAKARTLPDHSGRLSVASIDLNLEHKLGADMAYNLDVLDKVTAPASLTASGWCAPSNNLYDLFGIEGNDGLIDLPTVQVTRGGLNVPGFISIGDAVDNGGLWTWTEDSKDEEETKDCVEIPCPEFEDYRLVAEGICVTAGNLTDRAFPELTQRYVGLVLSAHLHRVSAAIINNIDNGATAVTMNAVDSSAAGSILHAIDVQVEDYKSQYRMSVGATLEAIFPLWTKALIRADLAMRAGVALTNVTDADVDAHFASRKVRAQFVHDYQPMHTGAPAVEFAASIDFLLYPAGGYVRGDGGVIDLGVVRDSVLNATNDFTAAWTEQLYLVAQLGPSARVITVNFGVDGVTGCCPTAS